MKNFIRGSVLNRLVIAGIFIIVCGIIVFSVLKVLNLTLFSSALTPKNNSRNKIHIVAAENFWGSLVSQIGGSHVDVLSIITNPNVDPHEYESNTMDARAISNANYVIVNGAGYDTWATLLLKASSNPKRKVLNVASLLKKKLGDNPHFWYNPNYVNRVVSQMEKDLIAIDPGNADYYKRRYAELLDSLAEYQNRIAAIKKKYAGTPVESTESIFVYLADAAGLNLITPPAFMDAVAEGTDPPMQSVVTFENQLKNKKIGVKMLVYNKQTVTPLTETIKKLAKEQGIPIVGITETIQPPDASFQEWMNAETMSLQNVLKKSLNQ